MFPNSWAFSLRPLAMLAGAGDRGVAIVDLDPNGAAAAKDLKEGDVILEVSGKPVSRPEDVRQEIEAAKQEGKKEFCSSQTATGELRGFRLPNT